MYMVDDMLQVLPFTQDLQSVSLFVAKLKAFDNDNKDEAEDMVGGLLKVRNLSWSANTRILIVIADAPCHGRRYHNVDDSFPGGDPSGITPEDILLELRRNKVCNILLLHVCLVNVMADVLTVDRFTLHLVELIAAQIV
jgi:hypothetical protein